MSPIPSAMHGSSRHNRMLLIVFGVGGATGLHLGLLHLFLWRSWTAPLVFVGGSLCFSAITYVLWRWVFPRLPGATFWGQVAIQMAVATVVFGVFSAASISLIGHLLGYPPLVGTPLGDDHHITITPAVRQSFMRIYALLPLVPSLGMSLIGYHQVWQRVHQLQSRAAELTELAATAQLAALQSQINPHFLFNSLNSIAQLIHADPDKAEACVERLAEIFRYLLNRAEKEFVPLSEELHMAQAYLEIERARFGDRLRIQTHVDPRSLGRLIPNLILQPLVENAVKHGLSRKLGPGTVRIDASVADGLLTLRVGDDGLGIPDSALPTVFERGVGLRNLRARLERLYGPDHLPQIQSAPGSGTEVLLRLPIGGAEATA